jgi:hypothetical protein
MTTEEWRKLPTWVTTTIVDAGYSCEQVATVDFDLEARPLPKIEVLLRPKMPKDIEFTVVVDRKGG